MLIFFSAYNSIEEHGNISVDLSFLVLLHNTNYMNKLKFNDLKNV